MIIRDSRHLFKTCVFGTGKDSFRLLFCKSWWSCISTWWCKTGDTRRADFCDRTWLLLKANFRQQHIADRWKRLRRIKQIKSYLVEVTTRSQVAEYFLSRWTDSRYNTRTFSLLLTSEQLWWFKWPLTPYESKVTTTEALKSNKNTSRLKSTRITYPKLVF